MLLYLLLTVLILSLAFFAFWLNRKLTLMLAQNQTDQSVIEWLKSSSQRLDQTANVIVGVQKSLGEVAELGRSMKDFQDFLHSPKLRGNLGEQVLKELLSQTLPKQTFNFQYAFKSGTIVDAAIKTEAGIIPIDSKFPLDNFRKLLASTGQPSHQLAEHEFAKDVKRHIDAISQKYILPQEGTLDYALMYLPSEAVYYEIVSNNPDLADYAYHKRVLPVSPGTLYAYLRAVLMGFEGQKIETKAREILAALRAIHQDHQRVEASLLLLNRHLQNAYNQLPLVFSHVNRLGQKITATQDLPDSQEVRNLP